MAQKYGPLALSVVAGLGGFGLLEVYKERFEAEVRGGPSIGVVHVRRDVAIGQRIDASDVGIRDTPSRFVDRRSVLAADLDEVVGLRTRAALTEGDPLQYDDLAIAQGGDRDLSTLVPDGLRAVPLAAPTFDGLLRPGDRVDVVTRSERAQGDGARVVVERSLVLAIGGRTNRQGERSTSGSVVLAVGVKEAEALAEAQQAGPLLLALRNPLDLATMGDDAETDVTEERTAPVGPRPSKGVERVR